VLFSLTTLKILIISINKISIIPSEIIKMTGLEILNINHSYDLEKINVNLCKLKNLKALDLSFNRSLFANGNFIDYSIHSDCHLDTNNSYCDENSSVYKHDETFFRLKNLRICNNSLSLFPSYFQNFVNLEELDISANDFEKIPHEIYSFSKLKKLEINHNRIKIIIIDNNIFNNMEELYIRNNEIQQCSISDNALQNLTSFDLSANKIYKLDNNILKLKRLKYLIIFNNILTEIERCHYTSDGPIYLNLDLKNISVLPNIFYYNNIEKLIIRCSERFDDNINIFENVSSDSKIKELDLSDCYLTNIPNTIFKLTNLIVFMANNNQIVELKNVFGINSSLELLELSHNQIVNIDKNIFDIPTLRNIMLYQNNIELLPVRINNVSNRNILINLSRNPLLQQINTGIQNSELITIEQVDPNILRNIRYDREIIL
ncbi:Leucine rich repeat protein, partial [Spraguea lophii 42_110]